jgi:hypothetical protein
MASEPPDGPKPATGDLGERSLKSFPILHAQYIKPAEKGTPWICKHCKELF